MEIHNPQMLRILKFVAEMKKNKFPNAGSFAKLLHETDINENTPCCRSERTIMRDIAVLRKDFHAPIAYDAARRGYYLTSPDWDLEVPVQFTDLSIFLLGLQFALDIIPDPVRRRIDTDIRSLLTNGKNNVQELSEAMLDSFICSSGTKSSVDPEIFRKVFIAWSQCQTITFCHTTSEGTVSEHKFEPHIISFFKGTWFIKGFEADSREVNCHAIQHLNRIRYVDCFVCKDRNLIKRTRKYGLFETPRIGNIKLRCAPSMAAALHEQQKVRKYRMITEDDGSVILFMKPEDENAVLRWVLSEAGKIEILQPETLRKKAAYCAAKILIINS